MKLSLGLKTLSHRHLAQCYCLARHPSWKKDARTANGIQRAKHFLLPARAGHKQLAPQPRQDGWEPGAGSLGQGHARPLQKRSRDSVPQHLCSSSSTGDGVRAQELPMSADGGWRGTRAGQAGPKGASRTSSEAEAGPCLDQPPEIGPFWWQVHLLALELNKINYIIKKKKKDKQNLHLLSCKYNYLDQTVEKQKHLVEK